MLEEINEKLCAGKTCLSGEAAINTPLKRAQTVLNTVPLE